VKYPLLASLFVFAAVATFGQGRPRTTQCNADVAAWHTSSFNLANYDAMPSVKLVKREREMLECADAVGASNIGQYAEFMDVAYDYVAARETRYRKFLERHHLLSEFYREDIAATLERPR
jgi:hypothetical protein